MEIFKMLLTFIFVSFVKVSCLDNSEINLSVDYFKFKNVSFVCLLVCYDGDTNSGWEIKLAKKAMKEYFSIFLVNVEKEDLIKTISCFQDQTTSGILFHSKCTIFRQVMYWASKNLFFGQNYKWLLIHDVDRSKEEHNIINTLNSTTMYKDLKHDINEYNNSVIDELENVNINVDADIKLALKTGNGMYKIHDVFSFGTIQGGQLIITAIGDWSLDLGLKIWLNSDYYRQRWDFHNLPLRMAVVSTRPKLFNPDMMTNMIGIDDVNVITKITSTVLHIIAETHNFRFVYIVIDRWIGSFNKNSTRVAANLLYFREADVTLLRFNSELRDRIDFVNPPVTTLQTKYYYRIPNYGIGKYENRFISPLSPGVWGCILGVSLLCGIVLVVAGKLERRISWAQYAVFTVIAFICQQFFEGNDDNEVKKDSTARKVTLLVTGISCLLLYNYYTSSVVSWLLNGPPPSINSLRELLDSPLELIYEDIGYTKTWLQIPGYFYNVRNAKIETELRNKKVFTKKKNDPLLMSLNEGIDMVKAGGYAFHAQVANANTRISQTFDKMELCELGSLQSMAKTDLYVSIPQKSPYKEFFAWRLARLKETGLISCIQLRLAAPDISCDGSVPQALALGRAAPAFIMLFFGFLVSACVLAAEIFTYRMMQKKKLIIPFEN